MLFQAFYDLHQEGTFFKFLPSHWYSVIQLKEAFNTSDMNRTDTAYHVANKQLEHLDKHKGTGGTATNSHHCKETDNSLINLSSPFIGSLLSVLP